MYAILFLVISNIFMTAAWYGHLKWFGDKDGKSAWPLWAVIGISWAIALAEYCFQVPANRIGYFKEGYSAAQLKTIQEIITLVVFVVFSVLVLEEKFRWNHVVGFAFLLAGAVFIFNPFKI